ncbi:MAG: M28 family peptidase [Planctomycetota bacterium]|nr:M28 family peptidase [Planctomycetota bacterium]
MIRPSSRPNARPSSTPPPCPSAPAELGEIDKGELLGHIQFLASEDFRGREAGTPDQLRAAEYIAAEFKRFGLPPYGEPDEAGARTYFQSFNLPVCNGLGPANEMTLEVGSEKRAFKVKDDFLPLPANEESPQVAQGAIVFAGYGIAAPEYEYDDFKGVDLAGKWALILRYEPQEHDPNSKFGGKRMTRHANFTAKIAACVLRRAAGVLIVNGPHGSGAKEEFPEAKGACFGDYKIPVLMVKRSLADALLKPAGKSLGDLQAAIDKDLSCQSFELPGLKLGAVSDLVIDPKTTKNVMALLEGSDPELKKEVVVVGAHCDHVGLGYFGSLMGPKGAGQIHPGADDNASGSAGLLEVAQYFAKLAPEARPRRSILFQAYSGEEKGLLGSEYYVRHPIVPLKDTVAMLNMDMIGRSTDGAVQVSGVGTGKGLKELVQKHGNDPALKVYLSSGGVAPSDNTSFYRKNIPVLFFFTGTHPDYHRPSDTWDKINAPAAAAIAGMAAELAFEIAHRPERIEFIKSNAQGYLGVGVDRKAAAEAKGYPIGEVAAGSPAEKVGILNGDLIVKAGGQEIGRAGDLPMALIGYAPGDPVELVIQRGDEQKTFLVVLGERGK